VITSDNILGTSKGVLETLEIASRSNMFSTFLADITQVNINNSREVVKFSNFPIINKLKSSINKN
jgi:hypothetical protein